MIKRIRQGKTTYEVVDCVFCGNIVEVNELDEKAIESLPLQESSFQMCELCDRESFDRAMTK